MGDEFRGGIVIFGGRKKKIRSEFMELGPFGFKGIVKLNIEQSYKAEATNLKIEFKS